MKKAINLNADLGESFGAYSIGNDLEMMRLVNSANVACGFHASDPVVMNRTVKEALTNGVSIGAHPSFPDLQGFGRRRMDIPTDELRAMILFQIGALQAIAAANNTHVSHVKPHGALYNMASVDSSIAECITQAVKMLDDKMILLAGAGSCLYRAGVEAGLKTAGEIFADRTYTEDGNLTPRSEPGAVIHDPAQSAAQIISFLEAGKILTASGKEIDAPFHSICVHGDSPNAINVAGHVKDRLSKAGYELLALTEIEM